MHGDIGCEAAIATRKSPSREMLALGPSVVLYGILDVAVDGYLSTVAGLQEDIDEIETAVFAGSSRGADTNRSGQ